MKEKYYRVAKSISRWKLDNPFENWLGSLADRSEFWKRIYVLYYKLADSGYYTKGLPYLRNEMERQRPNAQIAEWGG